MSMTQKNALETILPHRRDRIVVTTMSAVTLWPELSNSPLDFHYQPSSMGQAPALALGLALSQPGRGVIVLNGDGCTLMNLGALVTLAQQTLPIYLIVLDNGLYEVTGGQPVAGAGRTDFGQLAKGAGFSRVYAFDSLADWKANAAEALDGPGPVFIWLKVEARYGQKTPKAPVPIVEQIANLRKALGVPT